MKNDPKTGAGGIGFFTTGTPRHLRFIQICLSPPDVPDFLYATGRGLFQTKVMCNWILIFKTAIAIMIAIKNQSKIIANRFSFQIRIAILIVKSISDFHLQIGLRLKTGFLPAITDGA